MTCQEACTQKHRQCRVWNKSTKLWTHTYNTTIIQSLVRLGGATSPDSTKWGYIISNSDLSKSTTERESLGSEGVMAQTLVEVFLSFFDLLRGGFLSMDPWQGGLVSDVAQSWGFWLAELSTRGLRPPVSRRTTPWPSDAESTLSACVRQQFWDQRDASACVWWELEGSTVNAT
jgi:hypothetical protein